MFGEGIQAPKTNNVNQEQKKHKSNNWWRHNQNLIFGLKDFSGLLC